MARYAIGDVQGCYLSFLAMLEKIEFNVERDELWLCGDLVNRGPGSLAMLRWVWQHRQQVHAVLGNHDLHLLAVACGQSKLRKGDTLSELLAADDAEPLLGYLHDLPLAYCQDGWLMTHAGMPPGWTVEQTLAESARTQQHWQRLGDRFFAEMYGNEPALWRDDLSDIDRSRYTINALTRMRFVGTDGRLDMKCNVAPGEQPPGLMPWYAHPAFNPDGVHIVFGHWASLMGRSTHPRVFALDTGCVWGQQLTALRLEDCERFSVSGLPPQC